MITQSQHYKHFLEGAKIFSREIYENIINQQIDLHEKKNKSYTFTDVNSNEWEFDQDYSLGLLELTVRCKMKINGQFKLFQAWVYDKCNTNYDTYHLIQYNDLYFHVYRSKSLLLL